MPRRYRVRCNHALAQGQPRWTIYDTTTGYTVDAPWTRRSDALAVAAELDQAAHNDPPAEAPDPPGEPLTQPLCPLWTTTADPGGALVIVNATGRADRHGPHPDDRQDGV